LNLRFNITNELTLSIFRLRFLTYLNWSDELSRYFASIQLG